MRSLMPAMPRIFRFVFLLCTIGIVIAPSVAAAESKFVIKALAEKKLKELPAGPLGDREFPDARAGEGCGGADVPGDGGCGEKLALYTRRKGRPCARWNKGR